MLWEAIIKMGTRQVLDIGLHFCCFEQVPDSKGLS